MRGGRVGCKPQVDGLAYARSAINVSLKKERKKDGIHADTQRSVLYVGK